MPKRRSKDESGDLPVLWGLQQSKEEAQRQRLSDVAWSRALRPSQRARFSRGQIWQVLVIQLEGWRDVNARWKYYVC